MENPDLVTGVFIVCGAMMFMSGWLIIRILHALDDNDKYIEEHKE